MYFNNGVPESTANGYRGTYQLIEAIKLDTSRVAVDEISVDNPKGGYILEIDERKGEAFNFTTTRGTVFNCSDPDDGLNLSITGGTQTLFQKIQADVQTAETALFSSDFTNSETGYRKYLDVDSFIDWYFVNEITKNGDALWYTSIYMYFDPLKQKFCMGPIWDFDLSLGNVASGPRTGTLNSASSFYIKNSVTSSAGGGFGWPGGGGTTGQERNWIYRLFQDPAFVAQVKARWNAKAAQIQAIAQTGGFIDQRAAYLDKAQALNFKKWPILSSSIMMIYNPTGVNTYAGYVNYMKKFLNDRYEWLNTNINTL
jgi:hypothetical protein